LIDIYTRGMESSPSVYKWTISWQHNFSCQSSCRWGMGPVVDADNSSVDFPRS
jgi:hypothetical protein